jgi:hypothetical protein
MNGYAVAKDDTFLDFIRRTKNLHAENNTTLDPEQFMVSAAQKYKSLVEQNISMRVFLFHVSFAVGSHLSNRLMSFSHNLWNAPSKDQAKMLTLESKVKAKDARVFWFIY